MSITIDRVDGCAEVEAAYSWAVSDRTLPQEWLDLINEVWGFHAKTWTPALGSVLVAKTVNPDVDPDSIKVVPSNPNSFSLRSVGHNVLVPEALKLGFSIRTTGREPLNNQPFFRYITVSGIERVADPKDYRRYRQVLSHVDTLDQSGARAALAAFVSVGIDRAGQRVRLAQVQGTMSPTRILDALNDLIKNQNAGPWVVQAFGAVLLEYRYETVVTRRLNDPSREHPGDVQGFTDAGDLDISIEARGKPVTASDIEVFVRECAAAGITRAVMLVFDARVEAKGAVRRAWDESGVALSVLDGPEAAVSHFVTWAPVPLDDVLSTVGGRMAQRLEEIEAPEGARVAWAGWVSGVN